MTDKTKETGSNSEEDQKKKEEINKLDSYTDAVNEYNLRLSVNLDVSCYEDGEV